MSKHTSPIKQSAQPIPLPAFTEAEFLQQIIQLARVCGWYTYHVYDSRMVEPGYPDLSFLHLKYPDFFMAELKIETGKVSPKQQIWIDGLRACGIDVRVWRPSDAKEILDRLDVGERLKSNDRLAQ